jgi:hypothetical protein
MAETTDRPQGAAVTPAEGLVPAPPDQPSATAPETYRPLSLLALAGFGLALLYVLAVLVGGSVALLSHVPFLMASWTFLLPVAALVLCGLARSRIRNSEGTLSGLAFTTWGLRLTVVVGLSYIMYYTFAFVAVRLQAFDCADQFFEQLNQGKIERAFLLGMGVPAKELSDDDARSRVEGSFNNPQGPGGAPGAFTAFRQSQLVRSIHSSGGEARFVPMGVLDWTYEQGGYQVQLKYQVFTPLAEYEMVVTTFGRDARAGESKGRQWQIMFQKGETHLIPPMHLTPRGQAITDNVTAAKAFAHSWLEKVNRHRWDEVYLDTLEPAERAALRKELTAARLQEMAPASGLTALGQKGADLPNLAIGLLAFFEGKLIRLDEKEFWTIKRERKDILRDVRETFRPSAGGDPLLSFRILPVEVPLIRSEHGKISFLLDCVLEYADPQSGFARYIVDGFLVVSAEEDKAGSSPSAWWIDGIEMLSGRTPPKMQQMKQQMRQAGQPGPPPGGQ